MTDKYFEEALREIVDTLRDVNKRVEALVLQQQELNERTAKYLDAVETRVLPPQSERKLSS